MCQVNESKADERPYKDIAGKPGIKFNPQAGDIFYNVSSSDTTNLTEKDTILLQNFFLTSPPTNHIVYYCIEHCNRSIQQNYP